jgi:hypothetical protein
MRAESVRVRHSLAAVQKLSLAAASSSAKSAHVTLCASLRCCVKRLSARTRELLHNCLGLVFARFASGGRLRGTGPGLSAEIKAKATSHGRDLPHLGFALSHLKAKWSQVLQPKGFSSGVVRFLPLRLRLLSASGSGSSGCVSAWLEAAPGMIMSSVSSRTHRVPRLSLAGSIPWLAVHASAEESGPADLLAAAARALNSRAAASSSDAKLPF